MDPSQFADKVAPLINASTLKDDEKVALNSKLREVTTPLQTDPWIYRLVVTFLGLTVIITLIGGFVLNYKASDIPSGLVAIGSAAIGALAGLLAPSPTSRSGG